MYRLCYAAVLGCLLLAARPALAQEKTKDDVNKLQSEVSKLRAQVKDLQGRLQKAQATTAKDGQKTPTMHWRHHGFGWLHFAMMHGHMAACQKMHAQANEKAALKGHVGHHHWGWAHHGWHGMHWAGHHGWTGHHHFAMHGLGHHGWHVGHHDGTATVEQRLERIQRELAALRQELNKTK